MLENPSPIGKWLIAKGKTCKEFFGTLEQRKTFPKIKHHATGKKVALCIRYAANGSCPSGADGYNTHYKANELSNEEKEEISKLPKPNEQVSFLPTAFRRGQALYRTVSEGRWILDGSRTHREGRDLNRTVIAVRLASG